MKKSHTGYMKVEDVLRYLGKNVLPLRQYKIEGFENHFFKSTDLRERIGERQFIRMETEVAEYLIEDKN